jgi:hypothetical protein
MPMQRSPDTSRTQCKKSVKNDYDPQIGAAALQNAQLADKELAFSQDYFTKYVAPALQTMASSQAQETANQTKLFNLNYDLTKVIDYGCIDRWH